MISAAVEDIVVPSIDRASVSNVPSTSTSPEISKSAITAVPVIVGAVRVLFDNVCARSSIASVPVAFGIVIVLSAVGSVTVRVVSYESSVAPSNTNELTTFIVAESIVVVVP